jgi:Phytanoyl-CoA dioxygenase (PhyH)
MTVLRDVGAAEAAQRLHRDVTAYPLPLAYGIVMVNLILAVDDFTAENGATVVAPGSHQSAQRSGPFDDAVLMPAVMEAGSALVYDGRLVHGAGANRSGGGRLGFSRSSCPAGCAPMRTTPSRCHARWRSILTWSCRNCSVTTSTTATSVSSRVSRRSSGFCARPSSRTDDSPGDFIAGTVVAHGVPYSSGPIPR